MDETKNSLREIFNRAVEMENAHQRALYLAEVCRTDAVLRQKVEELIAAHEKAGRFLGTRGDAETNVGESPTIIEGPGTVIGHYKLLQKIGEGGCGVVYMAEQEEPIRRRVALKIIKLGMDTRSVIARFEAERQALAMMDHPNIAKVFDAGTTDSAPLSGRPYFVMELIRGIRITDHCNENNLSTRERLDLFTQVCQAVQHAHQKGIIHRDLKPSNILVTVNDGVAVPKVIDFGIAKAIEFRLTNKTLFTGFEQFLGTPAYMSPEQAAMTSVDIDTRSDIYSLGVLLYELLTGTTPFDTKELLKSGFDEMRRIIRETEPLLPSTRLAQRQAASLPNSSGTSKIQNPKSKIDHDLDWVVMKCLEKDRARRYESANGLARDIERHLASEPVMARPPSAVYRLQKSVRRNKLAFAAGTSIATALVVGAVMSSWQAIRATRAEREQSGWRRDAESARQRAEANEKKAESETVKSRQVAKFLENMLTQVRPSSALGRDTTLLGEILDKTANTISTDLKNQPDIAAELQTIIGQVYESIDQHGKAETMQRQALEIRRQTLGNDHPEVARALNTLALVLWPEGEGLEGATLRQEALEMGNSRFTEGSLAFRAGLNTNVLMEVEAFHREALTIREKCFGRRNFEVTESLNNLAQVLRRLGNLAEAETLFREALATRRALFPAGNAALNQSLHNLAVVLGQRGKLLEAETLFREALVAGGQIGTNDQDVALTAYHLADVLQRQTNLTAIKALFREEVERAVRQHPNKPLLRSDPVYQILSVLLSHGHQEAADNLIQEVLTPAIQQHPDNVGLLRDRAECLARREHWEEAATDLARVIELDPGTSATWYVMAPLLLHNRSLDAYRKHCKRMLAQFGETNNLVSGGQASKACLLSPDNNENLAAAAVLAHTVVLRSANHPFLPYFEFTTGLAEYRLGHFAVSRQWLCKALSRPARRNLDLAAPAWSVLAMICFRLEQTNEAHYALEEARNMVEDYGPRSGNEYWYHTLIEEILLKEAQGIIEKSPQKNEKSERISRREAEKLASEGKLEEAEAMYRQVLALQKTLFGDDHAALLVPLDGLESVLLTKNEFAQLAALNHEILLINRKAFGDESEPVVISLHNLGSSLTRQGKLAEAEAQYRQALKITKNWTGHPLIPSLFGNLTSVGDQFRDRGDFVRSEAVFREALAFGRGRLGETDVAHALMGLTRALLAEEKFSEAESSARECLSLREKNTPGDPGIFNAQIELGRSLLGQRKYADAEPLLRSGYECLKQREEKIPTRPYRRLKLASQGLVRLYEATSRSDKAAEWKTQTILWYRPEEAQYRKAAESGNASALNDLAWFQATCEIAEVRDGTNAVSLAEKAVASTSRTNVAYLDTLAAACAEAGDFAKAVSVQKEAILLLHDEATRKDFASRLKLYESNSPYREGVPQ